MPKWIFIIFVLGFICSNKVFGQDKGFSIISSAHQIRSTAGGQTLGLPLAINSNFNSNHFYGFEQPPYFIFRNINFSEKGFKIYPNPFINNFTVEFSEEIENFEIKLFDLNLIPIGAQVVKNQNKLLVTINNHFNSIVILSLKIDGKSYIDKLIHLSI